jgi:iron complex outermembrane receptor protein
MKTYRKALMSMLVLTPVASSGLLAQDATDEELPVLETFIAEESAAALVDTVMPTDREISGLFGDATSVLEVPRSVTLLSPEIMDQFQIDDLRDLEKYGAGTQAINYYGVPGTPTIRGVKGGIYLNGMLRAYNRNEMPLSFGSLEAIEVVKGPAPADYTPTLVGGFVNLIPKSPFFDVEKGSIELVLDNWGRKAVTADYGAPFLLPGEIPAAYRVSLTSQDGQSYYDNFENDFTSIYGALKFRPKDGVSVSLGGEYFDYQSNEMAGWNRPTQQLIDSGEYVIGEPLDSTSGAWRGTVDRDNELYGTNPISGQPAGALAIERSRLESITGLNSAALTGQGFLLVTDVDGLDKYVYTPTYFANGNDAITQKIEGSDALSDPSDFADSQNLVLFGDIVFDSDPDRTYTIKGIFDSLETEKLSSYGYALFSEQTVFGSKAYMTDRTLIPNTSTTLGFGLRYTEAKQLQDFWDEPFSRRDITSSFISPNSILLSGPQGPIGGVNQWSKYGGIGGNRESDLFQASAFATFITDWTERLTTIAAFRAEYADYETELPGEVEAATPAALATLRDAASESGDTDFFNFSFGPNFEVLEGLNLYGNFQKGTSLEPLQAGPVVGEASFSENEMWEIGVKSSLLDGKLFATLAYYEWEQESFSSRENASFSLEGEGIELEATWLVTENFTLIGSYTWQEVRRLNPLGTVAGVRDEEAYALGAGTFPFVTGGIPAANPDLVYPGSPQTVIKLFGLYEFDNGFYISGGPIWQEEFPLSFNHDNIELPNALIWNLNFGYKGDKWEAGLSIENLSNEDYFIGSDPDFAANTLVTKAPETTYNFSVKYKF